MTMWPWGLRLGASGSVDKANVQYDGRLRAIPTDATSTYARLLDTGKAPKDDARIYSGQALDGDGIDDWVDIGDISASCKSLEITINPATTSEMILQLATGVKVSIASGVLTTSGLSNVTAYVNGEAGTTVAATEWSVLALTFDAVSCSDVRLFTDGSNYFDGMQSNVKLWTETLDSDDVAFSRSNPETPSYNRPGTSLTEAGLAEWWPLISGSGDTAYSWGGSSHGVLTNFAHPACWDNASALSDTACPQTALMEWGYADGVLCPLNTTDVPREITDETFTSAHDVAVALDHSNLTASSVVVTTTDGLTTYTETSDYTINYTGGEITVLSTGLMADATDFHIDYDYEVDATNFTRDNNELNFSGRSYTQATTTINETLTLEAVMDIKDVTALQYILDGRYNTGTGAVSQTAGTITTSSGTVYVSNVATTTIAAGMCHVVISGLALNLTRLDLMGDNAGANLLTGQMPLFKLWEGTLDSTAITKLWTKAKAKYGLVEEPFEVLVDGEGNIPVDGEGNMLTIGGS